MTVMASDITLMDVTVLDLPALRVGHRGILVGFLVKSDCGRWIALDTHFAVRFTSDDARMAGALLAEGHGR